MLSVCASHSARPSTDGAACDVPAEVPHAPSADAGSITATNSVDEPP